VPVIVTCVPPLVGPCAGVMLVMVGGTAKAKVQQKRVIATASSRRERPVMVIWFFRSFIAAG
jgi:hypothetical protein